MAENTIQRIVKVDTSSSEKTVRELAAEVEKARKVLSQLQAGTERYVAAAQQLTAAEQELNDALSINEARTLSELKSIAELSEMVDGLTGAKGDLIQQMVREQDALREIAAQRKALNKAIEENRISEEAAAAQKERLVQLETTYKTSLSQTQSALKAVEKQMQAAEGSYDQMSQTLGRMRDAYRQLGETQRKSAQGQELLLQIKELDKELKNIDASMGNYQRNVGNYESAIDKIIPGLSKLIYNVKGLSGETMTFSGLAHGATTALKGMLSAVMAFLATPIGVALTGLMILYKGLKGSVDDLNEAIEGNVELQQMQAREAAKASAWQEASRAANVENAKSWIQIKGAINEVWQISKIFFKDALRNDWGHFWATIAGVSYMKRAAIAVADLEKNLHELQVGDPDKGRLGTIEKAAHLEAQIARLRADAMDQESHSEEEREAAIRQALAKNKELYALKRQELELELQIAEQQHKASPDSAEFQQRWANLRAQREKLNEQEATAERSLLRALNKYVVDNSADTAKEVARIQQETLKLQQAAREKTEENEIKTAKENYQQDLDNFNRTVKEKGISEEVAAGYRKALAEKNEAEIAAIRKKWLDKNFDEAQKAMKKEDAEIKAAYKSADEDLQRGAARETAEAKHDITDPQELEQELSNIQQRLYEARVALIDQTLQGLDTGSALFAELSNERTELEIKNIERVAERERKAAEEKKKREKLTKETTLNLATSTLNALSSIIGEETAAGKAAAVAAAIIDTYKAANSAYASLASVPFVGPGLGAAAAAAAVVAGIANVKKIIATKEDGSNAASVAATPNISTPAVVTPPAVIEQVPLTRTLTSASEEERLNQMAAQQRVFVVYDDIAEAGRNVQVQQTESTF